MSPLSGAELAGVAAALRGAGVDVGPGLFASEISGGRSNLTCVLDDFRHRWVLRTPPRTGRTPSAHDVAREHRVVSALARVGFPVPAPVLLCEDDSVLGGPFSITGFVHGVSVRARDDWTPYGESVRDVVNELVAVLARLHRTDPQELGLESFGQGDRYAERQLRRWTGQWNHVGLPGLDGLAAEVVGTLERRVPQQQLSTSVVHGDYRVDNTLLAPADPDAPRVIAVVDWELSTLGDPVADVAMMCAYRHPALDLVLGAPSAWTDPRVPDTDALATRYEQASGSGLDHWGFHLALAHFKIAVIAAGIHHRRGTAGDAVEPYLLEARQLAVRA